MFLFPFDLSTWTTKRLKQAAILIPNYKLSQICRFFADIPIFADLQTFCAFSDIFHIFSFMHCGQSEFAFFADLLIIHAGLKNILGKSLICIIICKCHEFLCILRRLNQSALHLLLRWCSLSISDLNFKC